MDDVVTHKLPAARWWMLAGLAVAAAVSFQQMTQPDYHTHPRATPGEGLLVAVPGGVCVALLAWRMLRSRVETSAEGVRIVRVLSSEMIPWGDVAGIEVRPTTNRGGFLISARHTSRRLTKLATLPGRSPKRRAHADAFAAGIEAERERHRELAGSPT
jgi:hypothetical protein